MADPQAVVGEPLINPQRQQREAAASMVACIEDELRRIDLWETDPPAPDKIASRQPFCCDTLSCAQWLQWQFLPRMQSLLRNGDALPESCAIFPYAEYCFDGVEQNTHKLLRLIRQFDQLISDSSAVRVSN